MDRPPVPEVLNVVVCEHRDWVAEALMDVVGEQHAAHAHRLNESDLLRRLAGHYHRVSGCPDLVVLAPAAAHGHPLAAVIEVAYPGVRVVVCKPTAGDAGRQIAGALSAIRSGIPTSSESPTR